MIWHVMLLHPKVIMPSIPVAQAARMDHDLDGSYCHWNHGGEPLPPQLVNGNGSGSDSEASSRVVQPVAVQSTAASNVLPSSESSSSDGRQQQAQAASAA
jgi:hypothetical protein